MPEILLRPSDQTSRIADALADIVGGGVLTAATANDEFLAALEAPDVVLGVLAFDDTAWEIVERSPKPIVLVPTGVRANEHPGRIARVLVPLDGTEESAHAVAQTVRLFRSAGIEIVVLHVFDRSTVPPHWDQAAHARAAWECEFRARWCTPYFDGSPPPTVTLRSGAPGENVVTVAEAEADLIILGWSRRLLPGRAQTVRAAVSGASVPVMLIPTAPCTSGDAITRRDGQP
ncbi:universal stress protein [Nocardia uniformis]|uniref:Universal stress protein n=1 Tax=Nocardia uniformis TaxID=53432 RepID=A0A849BWC7_9NOCA|nr:universal stress protein [Nocardia uniformis]NNH69296.1 universal stress protein [Nocardia uniformis]